MRKFLPFILLFLICWTLAVVSLQSSISAKGGHYDCSDADAISIPATTESGGCATYPTLSLLYSQVLGWSAIGLFILPSGVSVILKWKNNHLEESYIESVKIVV